MSKKTKGTTHAAPLALAPVIAPGMSTNQHQKNAQPNDIVAKIVRTAACTKSIMEQLNRAGEMDVLMNRPNERFHEHCYTDEEGMLIDSRTGETPDIVHLQAFCHRLLEVVNSTQINKKEILASITSSATSHPCDSERAPTEQDVVLENLMSLPPVSALMEDLRNLIVYMKSAEQSLSSLHVLLSEASLIPIHPAVKGKVRLEGRENFLQRQQQHQAALQTPGAPVAAAAAGKGSQAQVLSQSQNPSAPTASLLQKQRSGLNPLGSKAPGAKGSATSGPRPTAPTIKPAAAKAGTSVAGGGAKVPAKPTGKAVPSQQKQGSKGSRPALTVETVSKKKPATAPAKKKNRYADDEADYVSETDSQGLRDFDDSSSMGEDEEEEPAVVDKRVVVSSSEKKGASAATKKRDLADSDTEAGECPAAPKRPKMVQNQQQKAAGATGALTGTSKKASSSQPGSSKKEESSGSESDSESDENEQS